MKNILTATLLSAALLTTAAHADTPAGLEDFDVNISLARKAPATVAEVTEAGKEDGTEGKSWWSSVKEGGSKLVSGVSDLVYGVGNAGYSAGMLVKGAGETAFGTGEYVYGAAHNAYGTLRGYDTDFMENGKSWSNAGWNNMAYGVNDMKDGAMNVPNTAMYFINGVPKVIEGATELFGAAKTAKKTVDAAIPAMV